ncbi:hypothetical protein NQ315_017163 [Exocentrus adspersus]|uniref:Neuroendocrine protein 7B2 n=1 Tax=Exocentrus adspersus TaxID=1586481 RepID=A0AAV8VH72_9CUCU|nr:hypothetical protein NQ315_017163 [Exocentrus adspersus]
MGPKQLHWLYTMVIAYGAIAWWIKALQQSVKNKLSSIQRLACRAITGAISSTPSAALEILLDLPPLHIYLEREARWATYRNRHLAINLPQTNIMEHNRMLEGIESHSVLGMVSDGLPVRINLDLPYNILLPGRDEWERNRTDLLRADSCWYTDGSKTPEGTWLLSLYLNCQKTLSRVGRTNGLTLVWIPGHVGLKGNEVADSLARRGAALEFIGPEPVFGLSYSTARSVIRAWAEGDTLQYWRAPKVQLMPEDLDKDSPGKIIDFLRRLELLGEVEASAMKFIILLVCVTGGFCYLPAGKDNFLSGLFLRDLVNRINGKGISDGDGVSYLDFTDGLPLDGRSLTRDLEEEQMLDYDGLGGDQPPSQHQRSGISTAQYSLGKAGWYFTKSLRKLGCVTFVPDGAAGNQLLRPQGMKDKDEMKTDTTLPAYCNPPNPCPVGYTEEQGCITDFENSASYSRRYQAVQDCMCDTEHMFDCPNLNGELVDDPMDSMDDIQINQIMQHSMKMGQLFPHKNLVAKKYHSPEQSKKINPFLTGEKLPVAAKKGNNVIF